MQGTYDRLPGWLERARQAIWRDFSYGRLDENAATARLLALDLKRRRVGDLLPQRQAARRGASRSTRVPWQPARAAHAA